MVRTAVLKFDDHAVQGFSTNKAKGEKMILASYEQCTEKNTGRPQTLVSWRFVGGSGDIKLTKDGNTLLKGMVRAIKLDLVY